MPRVRRCSRSIVRRGGRSVLLNLEECPDLGIRRSLKPAQLPARVADVLAPRHRVAYFFDVAAPAALQAS